MTYTINIYSEGPDLTFAPSSNKAPLAAIVLTTRKREFVGDKIRLGNLGEFGPGGLYLAARHRMFRLRLYADYIREGATRNDTGREGKPGGKGDVRQVRARAHGRARSAGILGRIQDARKPDGAPRPTGGPGKDQAPGPKLPGRA